MEILERIRSEEDAIERLRKEIAERKSTLTMYEKEFSEEACEDFSLVKEIFEKYGPAPKLEPPSYAVYITVMHAINYFLPPDVWEKMRFLFPLKGAYKGKPGDCVLGGHVKFTREEKMILHQCKIDWRHAYIGNPYGH
uniref:Uncharacterized protein n=1 Tax=Pithovirus LCPAC304 TaxID=2506594 RepID=A0A481Z8Q3_9VIRU|nr:MAG: hypothetical protein LCPAC304_03190 [Pithovirus LCPAC304]